MTFLSVNSLRKQLPRERDPLLTTQGNDDLDDFDDDDDLQDQDFEDSDEDEEKLLLRIKSSSDVQIYARPSDTIAKVKLAVLRALDKAGQNKNENPYVRLIASGRLLAPDTAQLSEFVKQSGQVVHAVVAHERGAQAAVAAGPVLSRRALRGTGIDASGWAVRRNEQEEEEEEEEESVDEEEDLEAGRHYRHRQTRRGFDRLRDTVGLRRSEVAAIRAYFSRSVDRWIRQHPEAAEQAAAGETDLVRRRLLQEDAWMESQGPASEFRLNLDSTAAALSATTRNSDVNLWRSGGMSASVGTDRDFMWGFMLGFFVGFLMLLWVWMPTVPHKQKLGILTGISLQLAFGLWRGSGSEADDLVLAGDY